MESRITHTVKLMASASAPSTHYYTSCDEKIWPSTSTTTSETFRMTIVANWSGNDSTLQISYYIDCKHQNLIALSFSATVTSYVAFVKLWVRMAATSNYYIHKWVRLHCDVTGCESSSSSGWWRKRSEYRSITPAPSCPQFDVYFCNI